MVFVKMTVGVSVLSECHGTPLDAHFWIFALSEIED